MEDKTIYYISEAAKKVQVENHVLRYWEEELQLPIRRNEMGHRCYTEQDVRQLQEIKMLKEQGLQLKAIRTVLFKMPSLTDDAKPAGSVSAVNSAESAVQKDSDNKAYEEKKDDTRKPVPENIGQAEPGNTGEAAMDNTGQAVLGNIGQAALGNTGEAAMDNTGQAVLGNIGQAALGNIGQAASGNIGQTAPGNMRQAAMDNTGQPVSENQAEIGRDKLMDMVKERMEEKTDELALNRAHRYVVTLSNDKENSMETKNGYADAEKNQKAARLQYLLQHMITDAVRTANRELCAEVKDSILKELDYQFRMQEERDDERWKMEEEHYRKIDEMIRERHKPRERLGRGKKKS